MQNLQQNTAEATQSPKAANAEALTLEKGSEITINHNYLDEKTVNPTPATFVEYNKDKTKMKVRVANFFRWYPIQNFINTMPKTTNKQKQADAAKATTPKQSGKTASTASSDKAAGKKSSKPESKNTNTTPNESEPNMEVTAVKKRNTKQLQTPGVDTAIVKQALQAAKLHKNEDTAVEHEVRVAVELFKVGASTQQVKQAGVAHRRIGWIKAMFDMLVHGKTEANTSAKLIYDLYKKGKDAKFIQEKTAICDFTVNKALRILKLVAKVI